MTPKPIRIPFLLHRLPLVTIGLGISMLIGYGTLFYSFSMLAPAAAATQGWSQSFLFGSFSAGLVLQALIAPFFGRLVDKAGGRLVMSFGSLAACALLTALAFSQTQWQFGIFVVLVAAISTTVQYEIGFVTLAQQYGADSRRHITAATLIAGFASTLFWPLITALLEHTNWRNVYLLLAAINAFIALPIHLAIPKIGGAGMLSGKTGEPPIERGAPNGTDGPSRQSLVLLVMAISFAGTGFLFAGVSSSLAVLMSGIGYSAGTIALVGAIIGPAQVLGRLIELFWREKTRPTTTAIFSSIATLVGLAALFVAGSSLAPAFFFAAFYGAGQGLASIVRGTIPLQFFGPRGYGRLTGNLNFVRLLLSSAAPALLVWAALHFGEATALGMLIAVAFITLLGFVLLARFYRSQCNNAPNRTN